MWMLAVALLHSISHGERYRPPPGGSGPFSPREGRGAGRGCAFCVGSVAPAVRSREENGKGSSAII